MQKKSDFILDTTSLNTKHYWTTIIATLNSITLFLARWFSALNAFILSCKSHMTTKHLRVVILLKGRHLAMSISKYISSADHEFGINKHAADFERDVPPEARVTIVSRNYCFGERKCAIKWCQMSKTVKGQMDVHGDILTW
ncbi:hypothetical protein BJ878DRAFT_481199 [Calycina marina]|uniref:Uncharacterized protein n=1 Tax=Calycina marina TaxID=1763456 RepID=A0A9P7Z1U1_9HELO|nr:hypothetical protein BJ878DRAFT_481199 [Calycina marina]